MRVVEDIRPQIGQRLDERRDPQRRRIDPGKVCELRRRNRRTIEVQKDLLGLADRKRLGHGAEGPQPHRVGPRAGGGQTDEVAAGLGNHPGDRDVPLDLKRRFGGQEDVLVV